MNIKIKHPQTKTQLTPCAIRLLQFLHTHKNTWQSVSPDAHTKKAVLLVCKLGFAKENTQGQLMYIGYDLDAGLNIRFKRKG